eukprot:154408-Ditylum_brightwellii.AAC.1
MAINNTSPSVHKTSNNGGTLKASVLTSEEIQLANTAESFDGLGIGSFTGKMDDDSHLSKKVSNLSKSQFEKQNNSKEWTHRDLHNDKESLIIPEENSVAQEKELPEEKSTRKRFKTHHTKVVNVDIGATIKLNSMGKDAEMEDAHLTTKEKIAIKCAVAVEKSTKIVTPVTIEFNIAKYLKAYHI